MWSTSRTRNGNSLRHPLHRPSCAPAFLLAEPDVHGLPVGHRNVDVGAAGDLGAGCYQPVAEQVAHGLLQAHVDQLDGLG